ncbi:CHAT domain-containing protein [Mycena pura]|uniref:CHAT domain-containing protein n=1 Tax=Mycena pura TaxID=153505 RepID=A0AAD6UYH2_9AGAR|nr:CHAT domain-containing protein [Mycena pura]
MGTILSSTVGKLHRFVLRWMQSDFYTRNQEEIPHTVLISGLRRRDLLEQLAIALAIQTHRAALLLYVSLHPDRAWALNNLANALSRRFRQNVIRLNREALSLCISPHPNFATYTHDLAASLQIRFMHHGNTDDLDEAVGLHRQALSLWPPPHPSHAACLNDLARAIATRFELKGDLQDLDDAIELHRQTLSLRPLNSPDRAQSLNNLGKALQVRFHRGGSNNDLDEAIQVHQAAMSTLPSSHPDHAAILNNLASALQARFAMHGHSADLDLTIELHRQSLALRPPTDPDRSSTLNNLANSIMIRFEQRGQQEDLDEVIQLHREGLMLRPSSHPERATSLSNLAGVVQVRFEQRGGKGDLDEAILLHREAVALRHLRHPDRFMSLNDLGIAIQTQFERDGEQALLDESVGLYREAVALCPRPHPNRATYLSNLAGALQARFERDSNPIDIDEAIDLHQASLDLRSSLDPNRSVSLFNLANGLRTRYGFLKQQKDLDKALSLHRDALALRLAPHPDRAASLNHLGLTLIVAHTSTPDPHTLNKAISSFMEASTYSSSPPLARFKHAQIWAKFAAKYNHESALTAYRIAIDILPQLAALHLNVASRQEILAMTQSGFASDAAFCAIQLGKFDVAVEFLEAARSVFWSQALNLRTPLDELERIDSPLASRLREISRQLEQASFRHTKRQLAVDAYQDVVSVEAEGSRCRRLNQEWNDVVDAIRMLPGFETLMRPEPIAALTKAALHGPVIILTASAASSHALVVRFSSDIQCLPLADGVNRGIVNSLAELVQVLSTGSVPRIDALAERSLTDPLNRLVGAKVYEQGQSPNERLGILLEDLWRLIVAPIFRYINLKESECPGRLWWCPTGSFAFLPIHAAGKYGLGTDSESVSNYAVTSYIPSLTALAGSISKHLELSAPFKVTAIIQPATPGHAPLPWTTHELLEIEKVIPKAWLTSFDSTTSVDQVLPHLLTSSIVHFACHGVQNSADPLSSALLIGDGQLRLSEIMEKSGILNDANPRLTGKNPTLGLAFLSACQTAMGDQSLPDEALHLAASLLFAGYQGVVATLWTMSDSDGPEIAKEFYGHIFDRDLILRMPPDLSQSARALHLAVANLRQRVEFARWVPFVHFGY